MWHILWDIQNGIFYRVIRDIRVLFIYYITIVHGLQATCKPYNIILFVKGGIPYIIGIKHDNQWKMSSDVTLAKL